MEAWADLLPFGVMLVGIGTVFVIVGMHYLLFEQ
jgi:hypothetical protein